MNIYVLCPDHNRPSGGVRKLYRHVDVLTEHGWPASILHHRPGFCCTWFDHQTRIQYMPDVALTPSDYLVVSEVYGPVIHDIQPGVPKVIFNQGCYLTFHGYSLEKKDDDPPYLHPDVKAVLVVSEDSRAYLSHVFPGLWIHRLRYGIEPSLFRYEAQKKRQIAFMPRRNREAVRQVINALNYGGVLQGFDLAAIDDRDERETADMLRESLLFLSFSEAEGFGLPPAEAMACGCVVVGYHGMGGREFFLPQHCFPVPQGDIMAMVRTVERVAGMAIDSPETLAAYGQRAARFCGGVLFSRARRERHRALLDNDSRWREWPLEAHRITVPRVHTLLRCVEQRRMPRVRSADSRSTTLRSRSVL